MTKIYIYDINDDTLFNPITQTRPVFELLCGAFSYLQRIERLLPADESCGLIIRDELAEYVEYPNCEVNRLSKCEKVVLLSGLVAFDEKAIKTILKAKSGTVVHNGDDVLAMVLDYDEICDSESCDFSLDDLEKMEFDEHIKLEIKVPQGIWDLPLMTGEQIAKDYKMLVTTKAFKTYDDSFQSVHTIDSESILIGNNVAIEPFSLLDASDGAIIIEDDVKIASGSQLRGPLFIGRGTQVLSARVSGGCSFGAVCRLGGEIEQSIVQGYSNKYHDGFLGHSYLGKWVNLGALTTNSDLKNNYGQIKYSISKSETCDTGSIKVGVFIGDHAKTGIGTLINSGSNIGVAVNVFGGGMAPKYIKSFSWGSSSDGFVQYDIDKAIETARTVTGRRSVSLSENEANLLRSIASKSWT